MNMVLMRKLSLLLPAPQNPPAGFCGVLTRKQWKGVIDFARHSVLCLQWPCVRFTISLSLPVAGSPSLRGAKHLQEDIHESLI